MTARRSQRRYWIGALVAGVIGIASGGPLAGLGLLILIGVNFAGMFVMGRRFARRGGRSENVAIIWLILGGWLTVLVYASLSPRATA